MQILGQEDNRLSLEVAIEQDLPALLIGETGTGKTTLVREYAEIHKRELLRVSCTGQTSTDEILGKWLIRDKETYWQDGAITMAMRKGWWVVVDEVNSALPEVLFSLHSLLDDDKKITLVEKDGEVVRPEKNFRFFATMNPMDEYAGTKELNKAFLSRFAVVLHVDYPEPDVEINILTNVGVDKSIAKLMVGVATLLRNAKDEDKIFYTCSTRDLIYWGMLSNLVGLDRSFEIAVMNKADVDRKTVHEIYSKNVKPLKDIAKKYKLDTVKELEAYLLGKIKENEEKYNEVQSKLKELDAKKDQIIKDFLDGEIEKKISGGKADVKKRRKSN